MVRQLKTTTDHIKFAILVASKNKDFLSNIKEHVTDAWFEPNLIFDQDELLELIRLKIIWRAIKRFFENYNELPNDEVLKNEIRSLDVDNQITDEYLNEFIEYRNCSEINTQHATICLQYWQLQRIIKPEIDTLIFSAQHPLEITSSVQQKLNQLLYFSEESTKDNCLLESYFDNSTFNVVPTYVPFIDSYINGGFGQTDVSLLLGATGAGKTTLSAQIVASMAKQAFNEKSDKVFVFATYEINATAIIKRLIANLAYIPVRRLELPNAIRNLSTKDAPQDYELEIARQYRNFKLGERERLEEIRPIIEKHIRVLDYSHGGKAQNVGCNGFPEVQWDVDKINKPIGIIVIDWVGMLVDRYIEYRGTKNQQSDETIRLRRACDDAFRLLSTKFNCPVLLVHQLSGAALSKSPIARTTHADAMGCKTIAVNAWHVFIMGNKDEETNTLRFQCTKTRHAESKGPRILYLDGAYARLVDVTDTYFVDPITQRIVHRGVLHNIMEDSNKNRSRLKL